MKKLIVVAMLLISTNAYAQASVVAAKKAQLGLGSNLKPEQIAQLLIEVAKEIHGGILVKTQGNNCLGHSCDIICFAGQATMFDVLSDSEGAATPTWNPTPYNGAQCDMIASDGPPDIPPVVTNPPVNPDTMLEILAVLKEIRDAQKEQTEALKMSLLQLEMEISKGIKIKW